MIVFSTTFNVGCMEAGSEDEVGISFILHLTLGLSMRVTSAAPPHQNLMNASHQTLAEI